MLSNLTVFAIQMQLFVFQPGEWSSAIAKEDMLKIRRLMLEKLFSGWRSETVFLRMVRYKASQILSRMVRRTKGPLWVKESTLVCFHMWFRYIQVKVRQENSTFFFSFFTNFCFSFIVIFVG